MSAIYEEQKIENFSILKLFLNFKKKKIKKKISKYFLK
jgi:hypothetical protein